LRYSHIIIKNYTNIKNIDLIDIIIQLIFASSFK
jgi:hypothetical protein